MLNLFKSKKTVATPKFEVEDNHVQSELNALNKVQSDIYRRIRGGERPHSVSVLILEEKATEHKRNLLHSLGVFIVINTKSGLWEIYE